MMMVVVAPDYPPYKHLESQSMAINIVNIVGTLDTLSLEATPEAFAR